MLFLCCSSPYLLQTLAPGRTGQGMLLLGGGLGGWQRGGGCQKLGGGGGREALHLSGQGQFCSVPAVLVPTYFLSTLLFSVAGLLENLITGHLLYLSLTGLFYCLQVYHSSRTYLPPAGSLPVAWLLCAAFDAHSIF